MSEGVSKKSKQASQRVSAAERATKASSTEQAHEWAVHANERIDEQVAQYFSLYFWLFWPTVQCLLACRLSDEYLIFLPSLDSRFLSLFHLERSVSLFYIREVELKGSLCTHGQSVCLFHWIAQFLTYKYRGGTLDATTSFNSFYNWLWWHMMNIYRVVTFALWARIGKNTDWSTGPLPRPFARSLTPSLRGQWMIRWLFILCFSLFWPISVVIFVSVVICNSVSRFNIFKIYFFREVKMSLLNHKINDSIYKTLP